MMITVLAYAVLALIGFGPLALLAPPRWRSAIFTPVLMPLYGCALLILCSCWAFGLNRNIMWCRGTALTVSGLCLLLRVIICVKNKNFLPLRQIVRFERPANWLPCISVLVSLLIFSYLPMSNLHSNSLIDSRLGVDAALYADGAQSFLEKELKSGLKTNLAYSAFIVHSRWGVPFFLGHIASFTGSDHALSVAFSAMCLMHALAALSFVIFLNRGFGIRLSFSFLGGAIFAFNCNILNLIMESQWAELLSLPFLIVGFLALFSARNLKSARMKICYFLTAGVFLAASTAAFSEEVPLVILFILAIEGCDSLFGNRDKISINIPYYFIAAIVATLSFLPYAMIVFGHLVHLTLTGAGYRLPLYATLSDICGFSNIFHRWKDWMSPEDCTRSIHRKDIILTAAISLIIFSISFIGIRLRSMSSKGVWIALLLLLMAGVVKFIIFDHSNYPYMKFYTLLTPFILTPLILGCEVIRYRYSNSSIPRIMIALMTATIAFTGMQYLLDFRDSSKSLPISAVNLGKEIEKISPEGECIIVFRPRGISGYLYRYVDRTRDFSMATIFRHSVVLDEWALAPITGDAFNDKMKTLPIYCIFEKRELQDNFIVLDQSEILYSDNDFVVMPCHHDYAWFKFLGGFGNERLFAELSAKH